MRRSRRADTVPRSPEIGRPRLRHWPGFHRSIAPSPEPSAPRLPGVVRTINRVVNPPAQERTRRANESRSSSPDPQPTSYGARGGAEQDASTLAGGVYCPARCWRSLPRTGRSARCAQRRRSSAATRASEHRGLSPTAAMPNGASRCGVLSLRCTAATPPSGSAQGQVVERRLADRDALRARSVAERTDEAVPDRDEARLPAPARRLRPEPSASRAAALPRDGNPAPPPEWVVKPPSGRRSRW